MINLRSFDLNLLIVFEAIFETGSIVRAADRLALSQSATSHAIGRFRDACQDDLFVRVGQGITPTPVALRIFPEVKKSLDGLRRSLGDARGFDPSTTGRRFHIAIPHPMGPMLALALDERIAQVAPGALLTVDTRTIPPENVDPLRRGELDVMVDWMPASDDRFVNRRLFDDHIVFMARTGHPRATPQMCAEALHKERFVSIYPRLGKHSQVAQSTLDSVWELDLKWSLNVSEFLEIPYIIMSTDLFGFMPGSMAKAALNTGLLQIVELPLPPLPIPIFLIWHETRRSDEGHRWLRNLVGETVIAATTG